MQGEPGVGVRGLGSLTPLLKPGLVRFSPYIFLTRLPIPLAPAMLEENPVELQALPRGPTRGQCDLLFRPNQTANRSLHLNSERRT